MPRQLSPDMSPEPKLSILAQQKTLIHHQSSFSGPIPSPADLKAYNEIEPGLADRIVKMAEAQSQHRQSLESQVIISDIRRSWGGLIAGFIVAMTGLVGGIFLIHQGHDSAGVALVGTSLASIIGVFVYGTHSRKDERLRKANPSSPPQGE
ncbi:MAG TPA: DUF2335 domain-containing protein [Thermoguttaceae bacterium]|nr:DUF2335 domain-containing protein [Thermoguttaceae bacterium]